MSKITTGNSYRQPSSLKKSPTQQERILKLLRDARGSWISAPELTRVSIQYSARIFELRRAGFKIENRVEITEAGEKHGFFRLTESDSSTTERTNPIPPASDRFHQIARDLQSKAAPLFSEVR